MRILIVDDEQPARDKLRRLLAQEGDISALAEAADGLAAMQQIESFAPQVIFLDIQMPEVTGLEVAASLPSPAPLIVFATAYDQYAIQAFDANAIDYLLKPYDRERLQRALARVRERLLLRESARVPPHQESIALQQLLVSERGITRVIRVDQVQWIETADNYVVLHTGGQQALLRQTLTQLLDQLGPRFVRCHRRAAVQMAWIDRVVSLDKGDAELILRDGARVPCSRQCRPAVMERLSIGS